VGLELRLAKGAPEQEADLRVVVDNDQAAWGAHPRIRDRGRDGEPTLERRGRGVNGGQTAAAAV
jgi:hypothetical protein